MRKLDGNWVVPLGWVLSGFVTIITTAAACISIAVVGAKWVASVDFRLGRIEERFGIPKETASQFVNPKGLTGEANDDDTDRLSEFVRNMPSHKRRAKAL